MPKLKPSVGRISRNNFLRLTAHARIVVYVNTFYRHRRDDPPHTLRHMYRKQHETEKMAAEKEKGVCYSIALMSCWQMY